MKLFVPLFAPHLQPSPLTALRSLRGLKHWDIYGKPFDFTLVNHRIAFLTMSINVLVEKIQFSITSPASPGSSSTTSTSPGPDSTLHVVGYCSHHCSKPTCDLPIRNETSRQAGSPPVPETALCCPQWPSMTLKLGRFLKRSLPTASGSPYPCPLLKLTHLSLSTLPQHVSIPLSHLAFYAKLLDVYNPKGNTKLPARREKYNLAIDLALGARLLKPRIYSRS
jgi:hypothetical protein